MTDAMRIPLDLTNPGHFFACCGLFEVAGRSHDHVVSRFVDDAFVLEGCPAGTTPDEVIRLLLSAPELGADATKAAALGGSTSKIMPISLSVGTTVLRLDWWRDETRSPSGDAGTEPCAPSVLKTWAGQQSPQQILYDGILPSLRRLIASGAKDLLRATTPMTGRFGLEPTAATLALEVGWSPDGLNIAVASSPALELLAAIGLQRFRPEMDAQNRRECRYRAWDVPLPLSVAPAASAGAIPGVPTRAYRFQIAQRGDYKFFARAEPEGDCRE